MKKIFLFLILLLNLSAKAQTGFKPLASLDRFKADLQAESAALTGMESSFTQTKYIHLLAEKIVSTGMFYYRKPDKICLDYQKPVKYLIVINGDKIRVDSDGKTNTYDLGRNKMMSQINVLISACMTGDIDKLSSAYSLTVNENDRQYLVGVLPSGSAKSYMKSIDIYLDKKDFSVQKLKITEPSDDYTEYEFTAKKKNPLIPDAKFSVK
ncbi:MAG: outer membrane lipoprotein carrier protein LolA [Candidatus Symbiothrix sp.]|jgi:outer membrane lipoprotein-sorting protein|nr:outer membrane lipoprotein carrier protein LolA [Candidatus Symbiothrix sp.]